ncbi:unnamed protein product, partial [Closterium sp. NIES-54]
MNARGRWDAGQVGCGAGGIWGRWDAGQVGCGAGGMWGRWDAGEEVIMFWRTADLHLTWCCQPLYGTLVTGAVWAPADYCRMHANVSRFLSRSPSLSPPPPPSPQLQPLEPPPDASLPVHLTWCSQPLYGTLDAGMVWTWAEYHRVHANVSRFIFYDMAAWTPALTALFTPYFAAGVATVTDMSAGRRFGFRAGVELLYFTTKHQTLASNDCIYRSLLTSRWVILHDTDEFLAPVPPHSLPSLLATHAHTPWLSHGAFAVEPSVCQGEGGEEAPAPAEAATVVPADSGGVVGGGSAAVEAAGGGARGAGAAVNVRSRHEETALGTAGNGTKGAEMQWDEAAGTEAKRRAVQLLSRMVFRHPDVGCGAGGMWGRWDAGEEVIMFWRTADLHLTWCCQPLYGTLVTGAVWAPADYCRMHANVSRFLSRSPSLSPPPPPSPQLQPLEPPPDASLPVHLTWCSQPLYGTLDAGMVWTWAEYHRVHANVSRFIFYDMAAWTPALTALFTPYFAAGVATVTDMSAGRRFGFRAGVELLYFTTKHQTLASNDCIYRSLLTSRWVILHDTDEFLAPVPPHSLPSLLATHAHTPWLSHGAFAVEPSVCQGEGGEEAPAPAEAATVVPADSGGVVGGGSAAVEAAGGGARGAGAAVNVRSRHEETALGTAGNGTKGAEMQWDEAAGTEAKRRAVQLLSRMVFRHPDPDSLAAFCQLWGNTSRAGGYLVMTMDGVEAAVFNERPGQ